MKAWYVDLTHTKTIAKFILHSIYTVLHQKMQAEVTVILCQEI